MPSYLNKFALLALADEHEDYDSMSSDQQADTPSTVDPPQADNGPTAEYLQDGDTTPEEPRKSTQEGIEARQKLAEETRYKQMAAFLMTFHDRFHGPEQPLDENGIWGAVIHPRTKVDLPDADYPLEPYAKIRCRITPVPGSRESYENPNNVWLTPSIPATLGFPVKITKWPFPEGRGDEQEQYNYFVQSLFVGGDPEQSSFGKLTLGPYVGDALIVRMDGKDLSDQQVDVLLHYMNDEFGIACLELGEIEEGKKKMKMKTEIAEKYLCPEALHAYFEEFRRDRMEKHRTWEDAVSPVAATLGEVNPVCGRCYAKKPSEEKFLACADCRKRFYCSEKCQEKDEEHHLAICLKEEEYADSFVGSNGSCSESDLSASDEGKPV